MNDQKHTILYADDEKSLRESYCLQLRQQGYEVIEASNGEEALARIIQFVPYLVILDVMMPKVSGLDVLDIVKSTPKTKDVPVIILTALSQDEIRNRALNSGALAYYLKSEVTPRKICNIIKDLII